MPGFYKKCFSRPPIFDYLADSQTLRLRRTSGHTLHIPCARRRKTICYMVATMCLMLIRFISADITDIYNNCQQMYTHIPLNLMYGTAPGG